MKTIWFYDLKNKMKYNCFVISWFDLISYFFDILNIYNNYIYEKAIKKISLRKKKELLQYDMITKLFY